MDYLSAAILGLVEGLTEFLPVSSTGHMILVGHLLGFEGARASTFEVFIQLGAILAVVVLYHDRFRRLFSFRLTAGLNGLRGLGMLALTSTPALALGAVAHSFIKDRLFNPTTVAIGLGVGGIAILVVEAAKPKSRRFDLDALTWSDALLVGLFQCFALWPGVSRAASTILGGMIIGVDRKTAAEYSFLIAVPALAAAALYDVYKNLSALQPSDALLFAVGLVVAFAFAWLAVRVFLRLLGSQSLVPFGWYRIALALLVLFLLR